MFLKEMELKLCVLNTQRGQRTGYCVLLKDKSWVCRATVWMSGSLPLALCSGSSSWGFLAWEWWEFGWVRGGGVVQNHTPARWFVIIEGSALSCHPLITHPTPRVTTPPPPPSPTKLHSPVLPKHPLHSSGSSGFTHSTAAQSAPPSLHSALRENVPLWETHSTLSALCGCAMRAHAPRVRVYVIHMCLNTCLSNGRAVCIDTESEPLEPSF